MTSTVRTRFAPSPTGLLHVGGIRTALFAWLHAKQNGGQFILRIEDTDQAREVQGSSDHIVESLRWLGLEWDEGPGKEGRHGPYFQSQRLDIYTRYAQELIGKGRAYADPASPADIQILRDKARAEKKPFLYRNHRPENSPAWDGSAPLRFKSNPTSWNLRDEISEPDNEIYSDLNNYPPEAIDDFILIKSDGFPTYNFAHVVDDIEMEITDVIRGQEFLSSMPKYHDLYTAIGSKPPNMYTLPHVLGPDGNKKLSKRDGAKDILDYRNEGYLPAAMINFLATLGWNDGTEQEIFTIDELIKKFDLSRVQKAGARFDERRLLWLNGAHIRALSIDSLYDMTSAPTKNSQRIFWPLSADEYSIEYQKQVLSLVQERLKFFAELPELSRFFFEDLPINPSLIINHKQLNKMATGELSSLLQTARRQLEQSVFSLPDLTNRLNELLEATEQKPSILFSLIRIAVTQAPASPNLADTLYVLGKDKSLRRIDQQISQFPE